MFDRKSALTFAIRRATVFHCSLAELHKVRADEARKKHRDKWLQQDRLDMAAHRRNEHQINQSRLASALVRPFMEKTRRLYD